MDDGWTRRRFVRKWPGRIRMECIGLKNNQAMAEWIERRLQALAGVNRVEVCAWTGRILVLYNEKLLTEEGMVRHIFSVEKSYYRLDRDKEPESAKAEVAAAAEIVEEAGSEADLYCTSEQSSEMTVKWPNSDLSGKAAASDDGPVPLPLALSMGGLIVLGVKRLLTGPSAISSHPLPFYMSGLLSVTTGYPMLQRGFHNWCRGNRWNADLILGAGALSLALVRQNLVVLAGISILQYINWKRRRLDGAVRRVPELPPEVKQYSQKAGKWGFLASAAVWAVTRDPLRGIAVLLAANPRPAALAAETAWRQAELQQEKDKLTIPAGGSVDRLARTKTLLIEDSSVLFETEMSGIQCVAAENDEDKVICLAASLMDKSSHPWKQEVARKAKETCRTMKTAFRVEETANGVKGKINESWVYAGDLDYLAEIGIDGGEYALEAKRQLRHGAEVLFVARDNGNSKSCIGLLVQKHKELYGLRDTFHALKKRGWSIVLLKNGAKADAAFLEKIGIDSDWTHLEPGEWMEKLARRRQAGEEFLVVPAESSDDMGMLTEMPALAPHRLKGLVATLCHAEAIGQNIRQHLEATKRWNLIGSVAAGLGWIGAPLVNLVSDAMSLVFITRTGRIKSSAAFSYFQGHPGSASQEVAAASEAVRAEEGLVWYSAPWTKAMDAFESNRHTGLPEERVAELTTQFGPNRLEGIKSPSWFAVYLEQFRQFSTLILLGSAGLAALSGGIFDGFAIVAVLMVNAAVGAYQEKKAERTVEALTQYQPTRCRVLRNGVPAELPSDRLVPGDVVLLEAGDRVPADIRLIEARGLQVDESALTGESLPVRKCEEAVPSDRGLAERSSMLYLGTDVCSGSGCGIVVQTGMETELGRLMALMTDKREITPLQAKVTETSKKFVKAALIVGGVIFATGLWRGVPLGEMASTAVTLAASAVPEGLPVAITIALSAGMLRMSKKQALVRKLSALETLGRTTVLCMDKTGTLTGNEMTVRTVSSVEHQWTVTGNGYEPEGRIVLQKGQEFGQTANPAAEGTEPGAAELDKIALISLLCNNSKLTNREQKWRIQGDPTEGALLAFARKRKLGSGELGQWQRKHEFPFDSGTGKMSVVCHTDGEGEDCFLLTKGAPESVLKICTHYQSGGRTLPLTDETRQTILDRNETMAKEALRVLGFAYRPLCGQEEIRNGMDEQDMIFVGMVGMMDPPRDGMERIIGEAVELGIRPVMITGDHPITAIAIGRQLGIFDDSRLILSGHELERMTDEQLFQQIEQVSIFARVTPEQKLRIISALQRRGHTVVMTGDGVNDTPAIKKSDIGIAMGKTGTEATKQTADVILMEDHLGAVVDGVKEGRTIIANIRKAFGCLLTGNLAEMLVTGAAVLLGMPIPLVPVQILLMNLITDTLPAAVFAMSPGDGSNRMVRTEIADKELNRKVIARGLLLGAGALGLFAAGLAAGAPLPVARTMAFAALTVGQLLQTFSWKREGAKESKQEWSRDRLFLGSLVISAATIAAVVYAPPLARFFHTAPLALHQWLYVAAAAGSAVLLSKPVLTLAQGISYPAANSSMVAA